MKNIYSFSILLITLLFMASCDKEALNYEKENEKTPVEQEGITQGQLSLKGLSINIHETAATRTSYPTNEYQIKLFKENGTAAIQEWTYETLPELISLEQGKYHVKVTSHNLLPVDTKPYFEGTSELITVEPGAITEIATIKCTMACIKVEISFDALFTQYMEPGASIIIKVGDASYTYDNLGTEASRDNIIPVYFAPTGGESTFITATFKGVIDGYPEESEKVYSSNAGSYVNINYTLRDVANNNPEDFGTITTRLVIDAICTVIDINNNITVKDEIIKEENPDEGDEDDPDPTKPIITGRGFDITKPPLDLQIHIKYG
ncbi:MAG: DUF4493 domain-containing protein [Bacteroides sp.]|nr:DUF4493 domain-containing protein [Bacteroides sp.]